MFGEPKFLVQRDDRDMWEFSIYLKDPAKDPPRKRIYPLDTEELNELKEQITKFLESGRIVPSSSPYGAPILFAKKKDGGLRMCTDYW